MSSSGLPDGLPPGAPRLPPYVIVFGSKGNCTLEICPLVYSLYGYQPSLAANYTFIALYILAAGIHAYLGLRWKSWWFMGCMVVGAINAVIGYIGRIMLHYNPFNFAAFMLQIITITTGPVYYCAAIYITLAIAINYLSPGTSRFNPRLFYWIFIPCDGVSLVIQAAGGALSVTPSTQSKGVTLALVGMSFQVFTIVLFCGFFGDYLLRYHRYIKRGRAASKIGIRVKLFFGAMALAVLLILLRCVYRLVELHAGYKGDLIRDEGLFIALEGAIILASLYCLMIGHPGFVFRNTASRLESPTEEVELRGATGEETAPNHENHGRRRK